MTVCEAESLTDFGYSLDTVRPRVPAANPRDPGVIPPPTYIDGGSVSLGHRAFVAIWQLLFHHTGKPELTSGIAQLAPA
jgi:hypothetical protein